MIKIITAINDSTLNTELKEEKNIELVCRNIQYKEGILEILENNFKIDYIIIDEDLPGEIELINLIENILEKNEKIKIILTINKKNKINFNIENKNIIKIFYENKLNINKLKNYKDLNEINNKKLIKKNIINNKKLLDKNIEKNNAKIITVLGEPKVGKSIFLLLLSNYLISKNYKILLVELNHDSPSIYTILGGKKFNVNNLNNKRKKLKKFKIIKKYKKIKSMKLNKKFKRNIIQKLVVVINKNLNLLSYNKIIDFNTLKQLEKKYDYLLIEIYLNKKINKKIINYSDKNILLIKPNLLGVKNSKKIIEKNKTKNNLKIVINNYNKYSIDEKIIKTIFNENEIIGKIKSNIEFENLINKNLKVSFKKNRNLKNNLESIINQIT